MTDSPLPPRPGPDSHLMSALKRGLIDRVQGGGLGAARDLPPDIDGHVFQARLSVGGMGEVWRATAPDGSTVALKRLKRSLAEDAESRRRFVREGRAIASLSHPNIVDVHTVDFTADDHPYIVMELLPGPSLRDHLCAHGRLPWMEVRRVLDEIGSGVEQAHRRGIVHRDIKPANVVRGAANSWKVIDFGLARRHGLDDDSTQLTAQGQVLGTPAYMSPEALRGMEADPRSDIYSLGCVAFELLEGHRPFDDSGFAELLLQHLTQPVPPPQLTTVPEALREQVEAWLLRSLAKDPAHRFESVRAMLDALESIREGAQPVTVVDQSDWPLARRDSTFPGIHENPEHAPRSNARTFGLVAMAAGLGAAVVAGIMTVGQAQPPKLAAPTQSHATTPAPLSPPATPRRLVDIMAGVAFTCGLSDNHQVRCWGADSSGRLGRGGRGSHIGDNEYPLETPLLELPTGRVPVALASGSDSRHACIRWEDGKARCWGNNERRQLGMGLDAVWGDDPGETIASLPDLPLNDIVQIATGAQVTCARVSSGHAYCFGDGQLGQRGDGTRHPLELDDDTPVLPVAVGDRTIEQLTIGRAHGCALLSDGTARCWGHNRYGQLGAPKWTANIGDGIGNGSGEGERPDDPALRVGGLDDVGVHSIYAGNDRTCVITMAHAVRCWGRDQDGALGYPPSPALRCGPESSDGRCDLDAPPPYDLDLGGARIVSLSLGPDHSCALDEHGAIRCWGTTNWGLLGDGTNPGTSLPSLPSGQTVNLGDFDGDGQPDPAVQIVLGNSHACARMQRGGIRCWGRGIHGRLGYASTDNIGDDETPAQYYRAQGYAAVFAFE